jgi:hypothetical protein
MSIVGRYGVEGTHTMHWMCEKWGLFDTLSLVASSMCVRVLALMLFLIRFVQSDTQLVVTFDVFLLCGNDRLARMPLSCLPQTRCGQ